MWPFKKDKKIKPTYDVRLKLTVYTVGPLLFIERASSERILKPGDTLNLSYGSDEGNIVINFTYRGEVKNDR